MLGSSRAYGQKADAQSAHHSCRRNSRPDRLDELGLVQTKRVESLTAQAQLSLIFHVSLEISPPCRALFEHETPPWIPW